MLWKWKLGRDLDDVLHLLNGETRYDRPVPDARVCMAWRGDHPRFWVFARKAVKSREPHDGLGGWGWTVATDADDVLSFLRGEGGYPGPIAEAQIAGAWAGTHYRFYVFYRSALPGRELEPGAGWGWRLTTDPQDALAFLNGTGGNGTGGEPPVSTVRIATAHRDRHDEHFVFYRRGADDASSGNWRWHAVASPDDVRRVVGRKGMPPTDFQVAAPAVGYGAFQLFTAPVGRLAGPVRAGREPVVSG